jgi:hypothetical protein
MDHDEKVAFGRDLVASGWIKDMRKQLGVTANVVAGWLGSTSHQVTRWENGGQKWVHTMTALRFYALCAAHREANAWLEAEKMTWAEVEPVAMGAYRLGISKSTLKARLEQASCDPIDFGPILGEWIEKVLVDACRT